jgi:hypothetical protein
MYAQFTMLCIQTERLSSTSRHRVERINLHGCRRHVWSGACAIPERSCGYGRACALFNKNAGGCAVHQHRPPDRARFAKKELGGI